jgi:uncharacterized membrane protein YcaP (DUF421 family)
MQWDPWVGSPTMPSIVPGAFRERTSPVSIPDFGSSLPEVAVRAALIYLLLIFGLRLGGKRDVGQLSIPDLAVLLVISNAVQNAMVGENTTFAGGIAAAASILVSSRIIHILARRYPLVRRALRGDPRILMSRGQLNRAALAREQITASELAAAFRARGILDRRKIRLAVLEVDGSISIIENDEQLLSAEKGKRAGRVRPPEDSGGS